MYIKSSCFHIISLCLTTVFGIFLCTAQATADTKNEIEADALILLFATGKPKSPAIAQVLLNNLQSLITKDDNVRQMAYTRAKCWNQKIENDAQIQSAINYAEIQIEIYQTKVPSKIFVDLKLCRASYIQRLGELNRVIDELSLAIDQAYILEAPKLVAHGRRLRGALLSFQGNYSASLEDLLTSQDLYHSLQLTYWANINLGELAASYRRSGDAKTALDYQLRLEKIYLDADKIYEANDVNIQIASSYEQLGLLDKSITRYRKSQQFLIEKQPIIAADMSVSIANNLLVLGQHQRALDILLIAETMIPPKYSAPYSFLKLYSAKAQFELKNYTASLVALQNAERTFLTDNNQRGLAESYLLRSKVYAALENWKMSYAALTEYLKIHLAQDKSVITKNNAEQQVRFDTDKIKKENALLLLHAKDKQEQLDMLQHNKTIQMIIISLVGAILFFVSLFAFKQMIRKHQFRKLAMTDELTQLANRRDIHAQAKNLLLQCKQQQTTFSIISFDADHFKKVNDQFGHDVGDKVLKCIADIATNTVRDIDTVGRIGGEEFLILLPNIGYPEATNVANRLLNAIEHYHWLPLANGLTQTVSAGVASYNQEDALEELLENADVALYKAKNEGRNTVR